MRANQRDDVRAWPLDDGGPTGEIAMKTTDRQLMWLGMLLFCWAAHGLSRTAVHQRAHGARRAPGGCDERHLSCCAGRHLDGGETAVTGKGDGILDRAVWHLCKLADHDARRCFRYGSEVSNFSSRLYRAALARESCYGWILDC